MFVGQLGFLSSNMSEDVFEIFMVVVVGGGGARMRERVHLLGGVGVPRVPSCDSILPRCLPPSKTSQQGNADLLKTHLKIG